MIEHLTGQCGEAHPNLFHIIAGLTLITFTIRLVIKR